MFAYKCKWQKKARAIPANGYLSICLGRVVIALECNDSEHINRPEGFGGHTKYFTGLAIYPRITHSRGFKITHPDYATRLGITWQRQHSQSISDLTINNQQQEI